jgi:hypothetical protein
MSAMGRCAQRWMNARHRRRNKRKMATRQTSGNADASTGRSSAAAHECPVIGRVSFATVARPPPLARRHQFASRQRVCRRCCASVIYRCLRLSSQPPSLNQAPNPAEKRRQRKMPSCYVCQEVNCTLFVAFRDPPAEQQTRRKSRSYAARA